MHIQNLEPALRKNMTLVFRQKGLTAQAADAKATTNMVAADALFHDAYSEGRPGKIHDEAVHITYAMRKVVAWAYSL